MEYKKEENSKKPYVTASKEPNKKRLFIIGVVLALLLVGVVLAVLLAGKFGEEEPISLPASIEISMPTASVSKIEGRIDFTELQQKNADIVAWVEVPGSYIDYPVVRTTDNTYYLNHNEYGFPSPAGAVFIDMSNPDDFSAPVMVAYGHYMPDETYFTHLHRYKEAAYFDKNKEVLIHLPGSLIRYEIVAAFLTGNDNILYEKDYTNKEDMEELLSWIENQPEGANLNMEGVTPKDRLLVLSTCTKEGGDGRYLVVAKLVEGV